MHLKNVQKEMEQRPLFGTAGWWGGEASFFPYGQFEGGFKKCFFMAGKSGIRAFRNFFKKLKNWRF